MKHLLLFLTLIGLASAQSRTANINEVQKVFTPEQFGPVDTTSDDTAFVQAAVNAAQTAGNGKVNLGLKVYRITQPLVISDSITLEGSSIAALYGRRIEGAGNNGSDVHPTVAPYITGSVILVDTPGINGIEVTITGRSVSLKNFGIKFGDGHRFNDTGHGILFLPPVCITPQYEGERDLGVNGGGVERVYVYGHDGDHYAFSVTNMQLTYWEEVQGWGGGGLEWFINTRGFFGNSTIVQPYFSTFLDGTAHGYYSHANPTNGNGFILQTFIRPQTFFIGDLEELEGEPNPYDPPSLSQYLAYFDDKCQFLGIHDADWECTGASNLVRYPAKLGGPGTWLHETHSTAGGGFGTRTQTSNPFYIHQDYSGQLRGLNWLINHGTGYGTAAVDVFTTGKNPEAAPTYWGGSYINSKGTGFIVGTGGGGDSANTTGNPAFEIDGWGAHRFIESPEKFATSTLTRISDGGASADTTLSVPVKSGRTYAFTIKASFYIIGSGSANGLRYNVLNPTASSRSYTSVCRTFEGDPVVVGDQTMRTNQQVVSTSNDEMGAPSYSGNHRVELEVNGYITPSANGDLALGWGQLTSVAQNYSRITGSISARLISN